MGSCLVLSSGNKGITSVSISLSSVSDKIKEVTSVNSASQVLQPFTKTLFKLCWVFSHCLSVVQSVYVRIHYSCHINDLFTVRMYCLPQR